MRALLAIAQRAATAQLDAVRHKSQRKIDEETIVRELLKGESNKVTAGRLGVTERTVNNYKKKFHARLT